MNRRFFFQGLSYFGLAAQAGTPALDKHRNLFTGDSCTFFYNPEIYQPEGGRYTAKAVHRYIDVLADNGVDTFLCNPNAQVAWYPSKKLQTILDGYHRGDRNFFRPHAKAASIPEAQVEAYLDAQIKFYNLYLDLAEAGVDWVAESNLACRKRGMSPWVSVRMNDTHGADNPASHFNAAIFRDPEMRLSGIDPDPKRGKHPHWMALNYARPEVRAFMMSHIHEYVEDYDFEGIELDWLRDPHCLEPGASQRDCDVVTDWIASVRKLTQARGRRIGKAYPMGLRIPGNLGYLKSRGIDVKEIVRRGMVDFIGFSNFWQTSWDMPYDELRTELGKDVVFYGVVEDAPNWVSGYSPELARRTPDQTTAAYPNFGLRYMSASAEMLRANAAGKLVMGVHGIEQFNFFCTDQARIPGTRANYEALRQIHDLGFLRGKPKHYCFSTPSTWLSTYWESPEQLPVNLQAGERRELRLSMCREPVGTRGILQVVTEMAEGEVRLGISVNGRWHDYRGKPEQRMLFPVGAFTEHIPGHRAWNFEFDPQQIREGWNRLVVTNAQSSRPCKIVSVEIGIFA